MVKYFNFKGRVARKQFFIRNMVIGFIGYFLEIGLGSYFLRVPSSSKNIFLILMLITSLVITIVYISNIVKRCHDLNFSTFVGVIIGLLGVCASAIDQNVGLVLWMLPGLALTFKEGTQGPNKYGPDPLQEDKSKDILVSNPTNPPVVYTRDSNTTPMDSQNQSDVQELVQASDKVYKDNDVLVDIKTEKSYAGEEDKVTLKSNNYKQSRLTLKDLRKLKQLLDDGIITQEDFDNAKKKILEL